MYSVTIAKLTHGNIWAGFNLMSEFMLIGDVERICLAYEVEFQSCEKNELKIIETTWNGFHVMIQYRRIS